MNRPYASDMIMRLVYVHAVLCRMAFLRLSRACMKIPYLSGRLSAVQLKAQNDDDSSSSTPLPPYNWGLGSSILNPPSTLIVGLDPSHPLWVCFLNICHCP